MTANLNESTQADLKKLSATNRWKTEQDIFEQIWKRLQFACAVDNIFGSFSGDAANTSSLRGLGRPATRN